MNIRLENIHTDSPTNYVSFLSQAPKRGGRGSDRDSIHSVSSVRSVMSNFSSFWSGFGLGGNSSAKNEKQKLAAKEDLRYLYSAFTKIPCLRLAPDHKARLISGYEEFPFDTAVPLFAFKNLYALEIHDVDFRQFYGWDRLAEQLRSLTVKRAAVDDPADLILNIVLDDMDKRRRRSAKASSPSIPVGTPTNASRPTDIGRADSMPQSPISPDRRGSLGSPQTLALARANSTATKVPARQRQRSTSPSRPGSSRHGSNTSQGKTTPRIRRSSGSSGSSVKSNTPRGSSSNLFAGLLPSSKWQLLRHLSVADNGLTSVSAASLTPLAYTLQSLDLSANLFTEIPDTLATLVSLRALNLSSCMIDSLHSLGRNPLPAINTLNLRNNRLASLAGIEKLPSLERIDLRENKLTDPTELARLTGIPDIKEVYVSRNPFVKTHSNYRVTIFNLFRKTPGFTEDIIIDGYGPSYSERKQLADRVPEAANVPVVRPPLEDEPPAPITVADVPTREVKPVIQEERPKDAAPQKLQKSNRTVGSQKKKKGPKRRIVELTQNDFVSQQTALSASPPSVGTGNGSPVPAAIPVTHGRPKNSTGPVTGLGLGSPELGISPKTQPDYTASSETYRRKIEALRTDLGAGWLNALGDDQWDGDIQRSPLSPSPVSAPPRAATHGMVSGGRTLG
jgi:hypothetical protein